MFFKKKHAVKTNIENDDLKPLDFDNTAFDSLKEIHTDITNEYNQKNKEIWQTWLSIHNQPEQQKRQKSAESTKCTPLFVDEINGTAKLQGSSRHHTVTLNSCSCIDFNRRHLPCKHMYRLAMELGLFQGNFQTNIKDVQRTKSKSGIKIADAVKVIETLTSNEQALLLNILYTMKFTNHSEYAAVYKSDSYLKKLLEEHIIEETNNYDTILNSYRRNELNERIIQANCNIEFKRNMKKEDLIQWIKNTIPEKITDICNDKITVTISDDYLKSKHKIYLYLNRLKDIENNLAFGISTSSNSLPDDEITYLLKEHKHIK